MQRLCSEGALVCTTQCPAELQLDLPKSTVNTHERLKLQTLTITRGRASRTWARQGCAASLLCFWTCAGLFLPKLRKPTYKNPPYLCLSLSRRPRFCRNTHLPVSSAEEQSWSYWNVINYDGNLSNLCDATIDQLTCLLITLRFW